MLKLPVILSARKVSAPMLIVLSTMTPIVRRLNPLLTTRLHTNRCHSDRNSSGGRALPELPPELPSLERALPSPSVRPLAAVARLLSDLRWLASAEGPDQVGDREWLPMCTTSSERRRRRRASQSRIAGTKAGAQLLRGRAHRGKNYDTLCPFAALAPLGPAEER